MANPRCVREPGLGRLVLSIDAACAVLDGANCTRVGLFGRCGILATGRCGQLPFLIFFLVLLDETCHDIPLTCGCTKDVAILHNTTLFYFSPARAWDLVADLLWVFICCNQRAQQATTIRWCFPVNSTLNSHTTSLKTLIKGTNVLRSAETHKASNEPRLVVGRQRARSRFSWQCPNFSKRFCQGLFSPACRASTLLAQSWLTSAFRIFLSNRVHRHARHVTSWGSLRGGVFGISTPRRPHRRSSLPP